MTLQRNEGDKMNLAQHKSEKVKVYTTELAKTSFVDWVELDGVNYLKVRVQVPELRAEYYFQEDSVDEEFEISRGMSLADRIELMKTSQFLVTDEVVLRKLSSCKLK